MKHNVFKKVLLTTTLIIVASITLIAILLCILVSNFLVNEKKEMLFENCYAINEFLQSEDSEEAKEKYSAVFETVSKVTEANVFITDSTGIIKVCSCEDWQLDGICLHSEKSVPARIMSKAMKGEFSETGHLEGVYKEVHYICGIPLKTEEGKTVGAIFSSISPANVRNFFTGILRLFFFAALIPIIVMFFAEYFILYRFSRPIKLMSEAAKSMAKGDFSKRIPVTGDDEIGELAVTFNQMTNSLVQLESTRRRFIANVSHELKTPMTNISGFIDGIIDGTIPPEKQNYYLSIVSGEVKRLSRLVQAMLSLAKLESGEQPVNRSEFDITDTVFRIVVSQEQTIEKRNISIEGLEFLEPTKIYADRDLIYQVIYNLIDNSIKFTNEGGSISFKITNRSEGVEFKIRNTGAGIDKKDLPFVFDRFYKSDRSRSAVPDSTGLGLYLANTIISIHGGKISVESEPNNFTEFTFVLPNSNGGTTENGRK